jgi:hypothetical protein
MQKSTVVDYEKKETMYTSKNEKDLTTSVHENGMHNGGQWYQRDQFGCVRSILKRRWAYTFRSAVDNEGKYMDISFGGATYLRDKHYTFFKILLEA